MADNNKSYLVIGPDDKDIVEIFEELQKEMGDINMQDVIDLPALKKYQQQAKKIVKKLESCESLIKNYLAAHRRLSIEDDAALAQLNTTIKKIYVEYAAYAKKATLLVYEFREWITKQEIQFVIQFEDENKEIQYAQVPIRELIPALNIFMQTTKKGALATSRSKLQISNSAMQQIHKNFWITNEEVLYTLRTGTKGLKKAASKSSSGSKQGKGTGRIFETLLENLSTKDREEFMREVSSELGFKAWTVVDSIPGLRQGDLTSETVKLLIQKGILSGDSAVGFEASLKTVSTIAQYTEIQGINQIKNELFNIIAIIGNNKNAKEIQRNLFNYFTNTQKSGTAYRVRKSIAESLGEKVSTSLSEIIDKYYS